MEQKTLGAFLAVLRKAKGMTQKELAERLGVSDKTISHWERDESAPDISVLPIIADIFGVTVDELLRGERNADGANTAGALSEKSEKQLRFLLQKNFHKCTMGFYAAVAVTVLGALLSLLFYEWFAAPLVLLVGIFGVAAVIVFGVFASAFDYSLKTADFPLELLEDYRQRLRWYRISVLLLVVSAELSSMALTFGFLPLPVRVLLPLPTWVAFLYVVIRHFKD